MKSIALGTTTSAKDSGLLDQLLPKFEKESGYNVNVISIGSGMALNLARQGKVDVLLVHDPENEQKLIDDGFGTNRSLVMHNDFILLGPSEDPAKIIDMHSIKEAFRKIADTRSLFISRNDSSGTDHREKEIWNSAGIVFNMVNYYATKGGMAEALFIASAKKGYLLSDRATYLFNKNDLKLNIMVEGDELLLNIYHTLQVNPNLFPNINYEGAKSFASFLVSEPSQKIIGHFMEERFGVSLFIADAGKTMDELSKIPVLAAH